MAKLKNVKVLGALTVNGKNIETEISNITELIKKVEGVLK